MESLEKLCYGRGDYLFRQGETGDCGYIIASGEVEVYKRNKLGKDVLVGRLGAGELIGEICLLEENAVRMATVVAFTDKVEVLRLDKADLMNEYAAVSPTMKIVIDALLHRLRQNYNKIALLS
jgi:CRP-like cAMP-binding protein